MRLEEAIPRDVAPENWEGETTLVLGAPSIGKSHLLGSIDDVDRVSSLTAAMAASDHEYVVLDDFYRAFQAAREETQLNFIEWLGERENICISARPRSFDWLLDSEDSALPEQVIECFDRAYHLRYDPEEDRKRAIEDCVRIGGTGSDGLDRDLVEQHVDDVLSQSEYEFESDALGAALGTESYSATLVPGLVTYVSDQLGDANQAIVAGSIVETMKNTGREYFENVALNNLISTSGVTDLFSAEGLRAVRNMATSTLEQAPDKDAIIDQTESVISAGGAGALVPFLGPAAAGGGALALWLELRSDDSPEQREVFEVLAGEELTPTAQVELEQELDLPPRTIDNFQRLTRGDTLEELLHFRDRVSDDLDSIDADVARLEHTVDERTDAATNRVDDVETELEDIEAHLADHEDVIQSLEATLREIGGYEDRLTKLEETLATVQTNAIGADELSPFVSNAIQNATGQLSDLESTIRVDETRLFQTTDIQSEIPYYGSEDHEIVDAVDGSESRVVVLRGSHGTGKSTATLRACRRLTICGYDVRLPYFDNSSAEFVERALESTEGPTVVFGFYKRGTSDENVIRNERQLRLVLDWIERGICDAAILECREELYTSFSQLDNLIENHRLSRHFSERDEIEFESFEPNDQIIREVIDWVLDELEYEGQRDSVADAAIELAQGNLEIAKIAARFAATEDQHLEDVATMDELVWEDIKDIFSEDSVVDRGRPVGNVVFEYLSAIREARTDELETILHGSVTRSQLKTSAQYLSGYLGGDVRERIIGESDDVPDWMQTGGDDEPEDKGFEIDLVDGDTWEVAPDIYAEVAFRRVGLAHGGSVNSPKFSDYLDDLEPIKNDERYVGLAENLAIAYSKADEWGADQLQQEVVRAAYLLLNRAKARDLDPVTLGGVFDELVWEGIPLDPELIEGMAERLVKGTTAIAEDYSVKVPVLMINQLSQLWVAHLEYESQSPARELRSLSVAMANQFSVNYDPSQFLENVYSFAISNLADSYADPATDRVQAWLTELQNHVNILAENDEHPDEPGQFLENIFSMTISKLPKSYSDPSTDTVQAWLTELQTRATNTAQSGDHPADPSQFLANVYSMLVKNLADNYPDPTTDRVQAWLDELQGRATTIAQSDDHPDDPSQFLENVFSMAISNLADSNPDPTTDRVQAWLDEIHTRATTTAQSDDHDSGSGSFLTNVYRMAVSSLTDSYAVPTTDRFQAWVTELQTRVTNTAQNDNYYFNPGEFLGYFYGFALSDIYPFRTDEKQDSWCRAFVESTLIQTDPELLSKIQGRLYYVFDNSRFDPSTVLVDIMREVISVSGRKDNLDWTSQFIATGMAELDNEGSLDDAALDRIETTIENTSSNQDSLIEQVSTQLDSISRGTAAKWQLWISDANSSSEISMPSGWKALADKDPGVVAGKIDTVVEDLSAGKATSRNDIAITLSYVAKEYPKKVAAVHPELVERVTTDPNSTVRYNATLSLWRISREAPEQITESLPDIATGLTDDDSDVRSECIDILNVVANRYPDAVDEAVTNVLSKLFKELQTDDSSILSTLRRRFSDDRSTPDSDQYNRIARTAAVVATEFPEITARYLDGLIFLCTVDDQDVRHTAIKTINRIAERRPGIATDAVEPMSDFLRNEGNDISAIRSRLLARETLHNLLDAEPNTVMDALPGSPTDSSDAHDIIDNLDQ